MRVFGTFLSRNNQIGFLEQIFEGSHLNICVRSFDICIWWCQRFQTALSTNNLITYDKGTAFRSKWCSPKIHGDTPVLLTLCLRFVFKCFLYNPFSYFLYFLHINGAWQARREFFFFSKTNRQIKKKWIPSSLKLLSDAILPSYLYYNGLNMN